jgi:hypothetical protein
MIGDTFSYEQLVEAISICHCNKPIITEYGTLDGATHGYSVELRDCILIVIRKRLGYTLDSFTRLHELGHVGLGHLKYINLTRAQWHKEWKQNPKMRKTILRQQVTCKSERTAYTIPHECSAETIGTLWKTCIDAHASMIPEVARDMYGYQGTNDE